MHLVRVASFAGLLLCSGISAVHAESAPTTRNAGASPSITLGTQPLTGNLAEYSDAPPVYDGTATYEGESAPIDE